MRTKYTDFDSCPIAIELTFHELSKLIELIEDADGPFRRIRTDLIAARLEALQSARGALDYEHRRSNNDLDT